MFVTTGTCVVCSSSWVEVFGPHLCCPVCGGREIERAKQEQAPPETKPPRLLRAEAGGIPGRRGRPECRSWNRN